MRGRTKGNRWTGLLAVFTAVSLLLPHAAFAAASAGGDALAKVMGPPSTAAEKIQRMVSDYGTTSLQYAVMDNGKIVVSGHDGVYSKTENRALTAQTMYGTGSVSKMFTTAVILKLAEEGKISLDQPVVRYLPDFRMADSRYKDITVEMLLDHSSGLMGSSLRNAFLFDDADTDAHDTLLEKLGKQSLKAAPGAFAAYCNDGFTLAELVAERVTGKSFTQLIHEYITGPLGMKNTKTPQDSFDRSRLAKTYWPQIKNALPVDTVDIIGTGGIYSTAEDLSRFAQVFMTGSEAGRTVLKKETAALSVERAFAKGIWPDKDNPQSDGYGLGWDSVAGRSFSDRGIQALSKGGDTFLYHGSLVVLPDKNMAAVVLSSGGSSTFDQLLAEQLLIERLQAKGQLPIKASPQGESQSGRPENSKSQEERQAGSDAVLEESQSDQPENNKSQEEQQAGSDAVLGESQAGQPEEEPEIDTSAAKASMPGELMEYSGYYGNMAGVMKVEINSEGAMSVTTPGTDYLESYAYSQGSGETEEGPYFEDGLGLVKVSFVKETNGNTYIKVEGPQIVPGMGFFNTKYYTGQKLLPAGISPAVQEAWKMRDGKKYYQIDEKYTSSMYLLGAPAFEISLLPELPGYVGANVITGENDAGPTLQIPGSMGRDLQQFHFFRENGAEYLTNYVVTAISQDQVLPLEQSAEFSYSIGREGNAIWKNVGGAAGRIMTVEPPEKGAFFVYDEDGNCVNASLASGKTTVALPKNGVVCFAGEPGQRFDIKMKQFSDVSEGDWYYDAVLFVAEKGLFPEAEKGVFGPEKPMTHDMLAIVLKRMDEKADTRGLGKLQAKVSRQQMISALYNYAGVKKAEAPIEDMAIRKFTDYNQVSEQDYDAMSWAVENSLISGKGPEGGPMRLDPQGAVTRAEAAEILMKFMGFIEK